jgi:hypothetical protein
MNFIVAGGLLIACETSSLPTSHETEHLRIGTDLKHPLCAGDLVAFEQVIGRIENELGFSIESKISVSIWSDEGWEAVAREYCGRDPRVLGCTSYRENAIYTSLSAVEHELVHAAVPISNLSPFFSEGLADVYGGRRQTRFGLTTPADNLGLSSTEVDRRTARHFVMWLRETWGSAKLGDLARLGKHAIERFDEVYGLSFSEAQAVYFAEAPYGYPSLDACRGAPLDFADALGEWRAEFAFDCGTGEDVRVEGIGMMIRRTFVIPVAGHYSVSTDADAVLLSRCATGAIQDPIRLDEFLYDDVPPSYANELSEMFALYLGGTVLDLYFEAGIHEVGVFLIGYEPGEARLAIWPSLGPRPIVGGE